MKPADPLPHPASFRDPSGFVFRMNGQYYRQVNRSYATDYDLLMNSGLYAALTGLGLLIPHEEVEDVRAEADGWYKTLLPQQIGRISYAWEWSPGQLRDAALLTLTILETAIVHGMILKDATPSNIQFVDGIPVFIDSLSFERYDETKPWVAYRQFCECFLFPLYLQRYLRAGIGKLLAAFPEGIPAVVTAKLLPWKSRWNAGAWLHVTMQKRIRGNGGSAGGDGRLAFSKKKLGHLTEHLKNIISGFRTDDRNRSAWGDYYGKTILSADYLEAKEKLFLGFIDGITFGSALDLGANNGHFSRLLALKRAEVVAADSDWQCIEELYQSVRKREAGKTGGRDSNAVGRLSKTGAAGSAGAVRRSETGGRSGGRQLFQNILPLCVDISDPTPAAGFRNAERSSFTERMQTDLVVALALVHHLVLSKNIPLAGVARYFAELASQHLIIEFVPLSDEKAQELVRNKSRWHTPYDAESFERFFTLYFSIGRKESVPGTERILYLMTKNRG